ncbi:MAG: DUF2244 domain-containing protein [Paracoccaceae bacterium]
MPYEWIRTEASGETPAELHLWPYRSLPRKGFVTFIAMTAAMLALPLTAVLGSVVLWGLLPFMTLTLGGIWWALARSYRDGEAIEILRLWSDRIELEHHGRRRSAPLTWSANPYWTRVELHAENGPVPHYLKLKGNGRDVEIGRFLSETERQRLAAELRALLAGSL